MDIGTPTVIRVAAYNVHKCRGMDRRVDMKRIAQVIAALNADVVALQEILHGGERNSQVRFLAKQLGYSYSFGENRKHLGAPYGNATLSRLPIRGEHNYDITWAGRERRGCLRTDVELRSGQLLHVYNVHLGTSFFERPHQAKLLLKEALTGGGATPGPRVVVGDFNEWTTGAASTLMRKSFQSIDARLHVRTYPGVFPMFRLDHFYFDPHLRLEQFRVFRTKLSLAASDHIPLVADFRVISRAELSD